MVWFVRSPAEPSTASAVRDSQLENVDESIQRHNRVAFQATDSDFSKFLKTKK
jgi:hypothetical protein